MKKKKIIALRIAGLITLFSGIPVIVLIWIFAKSILDHAGIIATVSAIGLIVGLMLLKYADKVTQRKG